MSVSAIILAAGQGTRMKSSMPKVLHKLAKKPILQHVFDAVQALNVQQTIIVCGFQSELVQTMFNSADVKPDWAIQKLQLGTADAVKCALPKLTKNCERVLIICGDVPLINARTLKQFIDNTPPAAIGLLTAYFDDPFGLGRILRDTSGEIQKIVEEKEATKEQKKIKEINSGIYLVPKEYLICCLEKISSDNTQQEFYLTDMIELAMQDNIKIHTETTHNYQEVTGINTRAQLSELERYYQLQQAKQFMAQGVTILDPSRFDARGKITIQQDVIIDVNVILEGEVIIGSGVNIGPNVYIKDSKIDADTKIFANSFIEGANIGKDCNIGPFARIRPTTVIQDQAKIGNFVEIKNTLLGSKSKANHLSYIGDADIGIGVNIGAGVITCNYDGKNKHKTIISDHVMVGADTHLIAPVIIGKNSTIAAGTTIMENVPEKTLVINPKQQQNREKQEK